MRINIKSEKVQLDLLFKAHFWELKYNADLRPQMYMMILAWEKNKD